jgi:iron complex transport system ATP-binding protein
MGDAVVEMCEVDVYRGSAAVLRGINWRVGKEERWAVLGPNGSGKTTLLRLAAGYLHPARGQARVLGQVLGRTDVRALRARLAFVSASLARSVTPWLTTSEVVLAGKTGALEPWWGDHAQDDYDRALDLLGAAGVGQLAEREFSQLSEGERQQVLLARALMGQPELIFLDEPCAGLDMAGRERLLFRLSELASSPEAAPVVLVTHHVEEVPPGFSHVLLLRRGEVLAAGPVETTLSASSLSECFGAPLELRHDDGRWTSRLSCPP